MAYGDGLRLQWPQEYKSWISMKSRCNGPNSTNYKYYGGRGITVCERWDSFNNFLADLGPRPEGMTLDRIDSNGNYEPGNCRWATVTNQNQNRSNTVTQLESIQIYWLKVCGLLNREISDVTGRDIKTIRIILNRDYPGRFPRDPVCGRRRN